MSPGSVERYLQGKFRQRLDDARKAMKRLARSWPKEDLPDQAYALDERFRPVIPAGVRGWGRREFSTWIAFSVSQVDGYERRSTLGLRAVRWWLRLRREIEQCRLTPSSSG